MRHTEFAKSTQKITPGFIIPKITNAGNNLLANGQKKNKYKSYTTFSNEKRFQERRIISASNNFVPGPGSYAIPSSFKRSASSNSLTSLRKDLRYSIAKSNLKGYYKFSQKLAPKHQQLLESSKNLLNIENIKGISYGKERAQTTGGGTKRKPKNIHNLIIGDDNQDEDLVPEREEVKIRMNRAKSTLELNNYEIFSKLKMGNDQIYPKQQMMKIYLRNYPKYKVMRTKRLAKNPSVVNSKGFEETRNTLFIGDQDEKKLVRPNSRSGQAIKDNYFHTWNRFNCCP